MDESPGKSDDSGSATESTDGGARPGDVRCANCGSPIDIETWTPTAVEETDEGSVVHYFCDHDCLEAWRESE